MARSGKCSKSSWLTSRSNRVRTWKSSLGDQVSRTRGLGKKKDSDDFASPLWLILEASARAVASRVHRLLIRHGQVFINGKQLHEDYLPEPWIWSDTWNNGNEEVVPADSYFVMGDNRNHSTDSRFLGYQKKDQFLGKAWIRIWPIGSIRLFSPDSQLST